MFSHHRTTRERPSLQPLSCANAVQAAADRRLRAIHASDVAADYATNGCIGVLAGFAAKLFATTKLGEKVVTNQALRTDVPVGRTF